MGRGVIGKSKGDAAMDKMEKFMERSERERQRRGPEKVEPNPIIRQLKEIYPDTWQLEWDEMKYESRYPEYLKAKREYRETARLQYYAMARRDRENIDEHDYVRREVNRWKAEWRASHQLTK
jgi:hypothetical protein